MRSGLSQQKIGSTDGRESRYDSKLGARSGSHLPANGYALVHLLRRIGGSIYGRLHSSGAT